MSNTTSELNETRNARLKTDRAPKVGDRVRYHEWDSEQRAYVVRFAEVTGLTGADDRATLTVFTPAAPTGTMIATNVPRGTDPDHWDFA